RYVEPRPVCPSHPRLFFLMLRLPPVSTLFPYTTLFRSHLGLSASFRLRRVGSGNHFFHAGIEIWQPNGGERGAQYTACDLDDGRSEEHTSELQSRFDLVCRLLLEKKKK